MRITLVLALILFSLSASAFDRAQTILVRLEKNLSEVKVSGLGLSVATSSVDPLRWGRLSIRRDGRSGQWVVDEGLGVATERRHGGRRLRLRAGGELHTPRGAWPANVMLIARKSGFDVVAEMNLRDYLVGVVSHEMPRSWPLETLKAQAIAARSYALAVRQERRRSDWHLESTIEDQVFRTVDATAPDMVGATRAVHETDGVVLLAPDRRILKAYYHADCGGRTVESQTVWGVGPETGTAVDVGCPASPAARWEVRFSAEDVLKKLGATVASLDPDRFFIEGKKEDSRVRTVAMGAGRKVSAEMPANAFRLALGARELRSTNFEMKRRGSEIVFKGRGFGHGVGLCQWGSRALGKRGVEAPMILAHYYPKASVVREGRRVHRP